MKKALVTLLSLILFLNLSAQLKYKSPDGLFKAVFPAAVTYEKSDLEVATGESVMHSYMAIDEAGNVFMVSYIEYGSGFFTDIDEENMAFMEETVSGFFDELNIVRGQRKEVKNKKHKGLEYRGANKDYSIVYRVYIADNILFQIVSLGVGGYASEKSTKKLFKSFRILK